VSDLNRFGKETNNQHNIMSKWADYGISAVRYNAEHKHIVQVRVHPDNGETIGSPSDQLRQDVISAIKKYK